MIRIIYISQILNTKIIRPFSLIFKGKIKIAIMSTIHSGIQRSRAYSCEVQQNLLLKLQTRMGFTAPYIFKVKAPYIFTSELALNAMVLPDYASKRNDDRVFTATTSYPQTRKEPQSRRNNPANQPGNILICSSGV